MEVGGHRVLLDTNVWSRIADYGYGRRLATELKSSDARLVVAPAILTEASANPDVASRNAILRLIADSRWRRGRLPPEVSQTSAELVAAIRRYRPKWIRENGRDDTGQWMRLWTRDVYDEADRDPGRYAAAATRVNRLSDAPKAVEANQKFNRDGARESGLLSAFPDIVFRALPDQTLPKWWADRQSVPAWSTQSADCWWNGLYERLAPPRRSSFRDWTEHCLNLRAIRGDQQGFYSMWWDEVSPADMPRNWITWAVGFLQLGRSLSLSNAVDQQIATYLFDADIFVTGDSRFADVLEQVAPVAPAPMAGVRRVQTEPEPFLGSLLEALHP